MDTPNAVLPRILGPAFGRLDGPVRKLHRASSAEYRGEASVERGRGWLAALGCSLASLPHNVNAGPLRFSVDTEDDVEIWTRHFNGSSPMVSRVLAHGGLLQEDLGPARLHFELTEAQGALLWRAVKLRVFGIPIPRGAFDFRARVSGHGDLYHFEISAWLALAGLLIRYEGVLHVD